MTRSFWLALSFLVAAPLGANDSISSSRQADLRNLLIQDCGSCHGLQMKGGLGPALLPRMLQGKSAEYLSRVILDGRPGTAMPPWRSLLTPVEARWMADRLLQEDL
ncbi:MAG: cytochrome c [Gammaproteobacteria bacterium]|nr:cytochrome c [Gammaproteobacteria bacterium]